MGDGYCWENKCCECRHGGRKMQALLERMAECDTCQKKLRGAGQLTGGHGVQEDLLAPVLSSVLWLDVLRAYTFHK